jgi:ATP-dependent exoDNAse (exonuclease V) beta subunit
MSLTNDKISPYTFPRLTLIEASAGSGKTHALSRQYVEYLLSDQVPHRRLSNLLAITFTKNAAREMKERILSRLKHLALGTDREMMAEMKARLGLKPEEIALRARDLVDGILSDYSSFQVQTIDSFTARLAQASARELGFRPDFETATSYQGLIDYAMALFYSGIGPGRDRELTALIGQFLEQLNASSASFAWDPQARMREHFEAFLKIESKETGSFAYSDQTGEIDRWLKELERAHQEVVDYAARNGLAFRGKQNLVDALKSRDVRKILSWSSFNGRSTPIVKSHEDPKLRHLVDPSKEIWAQTGEIVAGLAVSYAAARCAAFLRPYLNFKKHLNSAKQRQGIIHIDDIAMGLASHLKSQMIPEVYLKLGARIRHYLVDEFQDTDPAQWRSLLPLWEEALASDGSVLLVGDLKQAIYMFRRADYRIMKAYKDEISGAADRQWLPASVERDSHLENLGLNYRCGQAIMEYTAHTFCRVLPELIGKGIFQKDRTGLTGYVQQPCPENTGRGYVEVRRFETSGKSEAGEEGPAPAPVRQALLEIIGGAHDRGYGYQEMAVLARTNRELEQAIDWLNQAGIPATSSSGLDIRKRRLVSELLSLLRWLDSPIDNLAWAELVRSLMLSRAAAADGLAWSSSTSDEVLVAAGQRAASSGYLYQECRREPAFAPLWDRYLEALYNLSGFSPVYDLLCLALERFGVTAAFPEEAAAVLKLLESVNRIEAGGGTTIAGVLAKAGEDDPDLFGLELPENMGAVQLLTFFKAKGMGFPLVINLFSDFRPQLPRLYPKREDGSIVLYAIDQDIADRTAGHSTDLGVIRDECRADAEIQELNSLYVACTRARNELYNLVSFPPLDQKGNPSRYSQLFPEYLGGIKGQGKGAGNLSESLSPATSFARPARNWSPAPAWTRDRYEEARQGEYLHRVLQEIEYLPSDPRPFLEELLKRHQHLAPGADPKALVSKLRDFLTRPEVAGWFSRLAGRSIEREAEFIEPDGRILRMDRLVFDPGTITVLDFKGGSGPENAAGHQDQMKRYLGVLSQAFPGRRISGLICYLEGEVAEVQS